MTAISIIEKLKTDNRNTNVFTVKTVEIFLKEFGCGKTVIPYTHSQLDLEVAVTISTLF